MVVRGVGKELFVCGVSGVRQASEDKEEAARIFFCDDDDDVGGRRLGRERVGHFLL